MLFDCWFGKNARRDGFDSGVVENDVRGPQDGLASDGPNTDEAWGIGVAGLPLANLDDIRDQITDDEGHMYSVWMLVRPKRRWVPEWFWRILACHEPFRHIFTRELRRRIA